MDEDDPQVDAGTEAPAGIEPVAEGGAPEAAEQPSFQEGMAAAISGALKDDDEGEGPARGPDGRFVPKDKPEGEPDAPPKATEAKPAEPEKPADDPYREPEGLKPEARERFHALAEKAKEATTQLETLRGEYEQQRQVTDAFRQMLTETGANDQEFAAVLDFTKAVKHGNWQAAEPLLLNLVQQYRTATGRDIGGQTDPFAQHPDIAQQIAQQQITPQAAQELVRARAFMAQQQQQVAQQQAQQQEARQYEQAVEQAAGAVRGLVSKWQSSDLDWPRKQQILSETAQTIAQQLPPQQWAAAMQAQYDAVTRAIAAAAPPRQTPPPNQQPLRPSGAAAGRKEPSNMLEAISAAIG